MNSQSVYEVVNAIGPLKCVATGIAVHGNTIYVGCADGTLIVYKSSSTSL